MKIIKFLLVISLFIGCNSIDPTVSACAVGEQGFSYSAQCDCQQNGNLYFDDAAMHVDLVTGGNQGNYYHIYSTQAPFIDFYSYAINTGDTSTYTASWNGSSGTYLSIDGTPFPYDNNVVFTTEIGGSNVGDNIKITFNGQLLPNSQYPVEVDGVLCVTIDEVVSIADYVYITDGSNLKIVNVSNVLAPSLETSVIAATSYYVNTSNSIAYVGHFDAIEPFVSFVNITNPPTASIYGAVAKGASYRRLSDVVVVDDYIYISDEYRGFHKFHLANEDYSIVDAHETMSMVKKGNDLVIIDFAAALHKIDVTNANAPVITSIYSTYTDVDTASYPYSNGSFHSWVRTDGTSLYVANIIDKKLKKFQETQFGYNLVSEVVIDGYATALAISGNYAFVTMKPSNAPLQSSFDGVKMINLNTMTVVDSKPLTNTSGVAVKLNYVYVTDANGLHIYDLTGGNLNLVSSFNGGFGNYIAIEN